MIASKFINPAIKEHIFNSWANLECFSLGFGSKLPLESFFFFKGPDIFACIHSCAYLVGGTGEGEREYVQGYY